jgi:DNA-directed RNA polymerase specialized sigma24 family protein
VRRYEEEVREEEAGEESGRPAGRKNGEPSRLQVIATVLDGMEAWERVLLRCRALDVPYEQIAAYTGKPAKTLKVYHARVRKKLMTRLSAYYPEIASDEERRA